MEATGAGRAEAWGAARSRGWWSKAQVWWAAGFVVVTWAGLGALAWAVFMVHALGYGVMQVLDPEAAAPPDTGRYAWALVVGGLVDAGGTAGMLWLLLRTGARQWPSWTAALLAAVVGGVVGAGALLLTLGVNPVDLLLS